MTNSDQEHVIALTQATMAAIGEIYDILDRTGDDERRRAIGRTICALVTRRIMMRIRRPTSYVKAEVSR